VKIFAGTGRASLIVIAATAVLMLGACSTPSSAVAPETTPLSCAANARWAVGDSLGDEMVIGIPGWPDSGTQKGTWTNYSVPGADATELSSWALGQISRCDNKPSLVVLEAGINDLAFGGLSVAQLEAAITHFVNTAGVPIHVVATTPMASGSPHANIEPLREQYNAWLNATYPGIAIDCNSTLAGQDGWLRPDYSVDTFVHLTPTGEVAFANCIGAGL
jgi:hypothetical protein